MAIITISRGSYSMGRAVAEKVAANIDYSIISRDLLLKASEKFHVPHRTLAKAIHDAPGLIERYQHTKQIYMAYIRSALLEMVAGDRVVYHGLAGHILLQGLDHVLKVRIISDLEGRIARKMKEEGITKRSAKAKILYDDEQRRQWTNKIYGIDPTSSSLYDMVICIDKLSVDDAVEFICSAAGKKAFETTKDCHRKLQDLILACTVKASLVEDFSDVRVTCEYGNILIYATERDACNKKFRKILDSVGLDSAGVHNMEVHDRALAPDNSV